MMVNLFNKYGSIDDESDTESSDDNYSGNKDESGDEIQDENTTRDGSSYMMTDEISNDSMVDMPESGISIGKNKEYKKENIFYMDVLKTIHKKISNQKMKSKERDKSILEYVQCMYNNVHTYKVPGF